MKLDPEMKDFKSDLENNESLNLFIFYPLLLLVFHLYHFNTL